MNKIGCQTRCHTVRRAHIHRQALLWSNPNSHVNARCLRAAFTTLARSCTQAKPELAAAALPHLRHSRKPSLGGKAFKTERPTVFFPLDPKKRHLHWATWSIFGSSQGGVSEDPKKRHHESQNRRSFGFAVSQALLALALCSTRESRRQEVYRAVHIRIRLEYARSSRHCVALDSLLDAASTSAHLAALVDAAVQHPSNVSRTTA